MPNCFQLSKKGAEKFTPETLQSIDTLMCAHFGVVEHPQMWYRHWVDDMGFSLACGKTFATIIADIQRAVDSLENDPDNLAYEMRRLEIAKWLNDNYVSDAFYSRK